MKADTFTQDTFLTARKASRRGRGWRSSWNADAHIRFLPRPPFAGGSPRARLPLARPAFELAPS